MNSKAFKGIRYRTLMYFVGFSIIILATLWLLQVVFLKSYYESMKRKEIEALGEEIVSNLGTEGYSDYIFETAFKNDLKVLVFTVSGNIVEIKYSGNVFGGGFPNQLSDQSIVTFIEELETSQTVSYLEAEHGEGYESLIYGQKVNYDNEEYYIYVKSSLIPVESTTNVLANQLLIVTVICLTLSGVVSFFISRNLSRPIVDLTVAAEKLAAGNLNVRFECKGYEEAEKLCDTLNYATDELRKTDDLRKDLIANVSHELRTPLTMIKAYAELIRDINGDKPEQRQDNLNVILEEADRLTGLVSDILDLSKMQSGVIQYDMKRFNLSELLKRTAAHFMGAYGEKGFNFKVDLIEDAYVTADEGKIGQVLYNLIGNAVNYSGDRKEISINLTEQSGNYRLDVRDSGIGISEEDIKLIFDKYFRSGESGRKQVGSGLGLSIVKSILEGHDYQYGVTSELGKGSDFYILFRVSETADQTRLFGSAK